MKKLVVSILSFAIFGLGSFAQKNVKEFLSKDRKQCDSSIAFYYRLVNYDANGKPEGMVKQFYINGEPEWEGQFYKYNKMNQAENAYQGPCTWFYPNGKKKRSSYYQKGVQNGPATGWYDSGKLKYQFTYNNGYVNGLFVMWYENGLLKNYAVLKDGYVVGNEAIYCNKYGECFVQNSYKFRISEKFSKKIYHEVIMGSMLSDEDYSYYSYSYDTRFESFADVGDFIPKKDTTGFKIKQKEKKPLEIKAGPKGGNKLYFRSIDYSKFFRIDVDLINPNKKSTSKNGLVFAYKDAKNYEYYIVDKDGGYQIGSMVNGEKNIISEGTLTATSSYNYYDYGKKKKNNSQKSNLDPRLFELSVSYYKDTVKYWGKSSVVYRRPLTGLSGDYMGFLLDKNESLQIPELIFKSEINPPFVSADIDSKEIEKPWRGSGSGFVITTDGYIVTNHHVIDDATEIEADLLRGGNWISYTCEVAIADEKSDLAILKITDSTFKHYHTIPFMLQTNLASVGSNVYALGYPLAMSTLGKELKFTEGTINARSGFKGELLAYQVSVPIQPGNSGGPLIDMDGNVIGVINSKIFNADNVAFAVKSNYITNLIQMLPSEIKSGKQSTLAGKTPADQVEILKEYIPLIKVR
jgi:S1-C subfamily serine protease/antitoxin component YwqK of YwqJK toxin-antitoxin module